MPHDSIAWYHVVVVCRLENLYMAFSVREKQDPVHQISRGSYLQGPMVAALKG